MVVPIAIQRSTYLLDSRSLTLKIRPEAGNLTHSSYVLSLSSLLVVDVRSEELKTLKTCSHADSSSLDSLSLSRSVLMLISRHPSIALTLLPTLLVLTLLLSE